MYSLKPKFSRAMVTGGAGFIGSHIVEGLLEDGLDVISVDDYSGGKASNLAHLHDYAGFTEANCDVTDLDGLSEIFHDVDVVFHLAVSKMTVCLKDPRRDLEINAEGTFNMLELARDRDVKKFVHVSTGSVYGKAQYYPTDEEHPLNPVSYYGVSKLAAEKYARAFVDLYGLDTTILRYYHVYGPRQESSDVGGVASIFARRAFEGKPLIIYGDGTQVRSFTYVSDLVNINKLVAISEGTTGEAYNCASGARITIRELADSILDIMGRKDLEIRYEDWKIGDIKEFNVDNSKIKALGMEFTTDFQDGLRKTVEWAQDYFGAGS